jgi:4'-phosphopantetheinyl transferase
MTGAPAAHGPMRVALSLVFTDDLRDPALLRDCEARLTPAERARGARFHFERDRLNHAAARIAVREALSEFADVAPDDWRFAVEANGKPAIAGPAAGRGLAFNLTHTDGLVMIGVARADALGVDAENLDRPVSPELADRHFAPSEASALRALPAQARATRLLELWTLKESFIKARGLGLALPLDAFAFDLARPGEIALAMQPVLADDARAWQFWQFRVGERHLGAVCMRRREGGQAELSAVRRIPGVSCQPWPLAPRRQSAAQGH